MKYFVCVLFVLLSAQVKASENQLSIGFHLDGLDMDINQEYRFTSDITSALGIGLFVRYRLPNHKLVIGLDSNSSLDFDLFGTFDSYHLFNMDLMMGYEFQWRKIKLTPKLGVSKWSLEAREGALFNPGAEETKEIEGRDFIWGVLLSLPVKNDFEMGLSYKRINPKFGRVDFTQLEFIVNF